MEFSTVIFASFLVALGLILIVRVRDTLREYPPADLRRDRRWSAYEERRMRLRRDRVWQRVDTLYAEFNEREAARRPCGTNGPAPQRAQGGGGSQVVMPGEARAASAQTVGARHERRADEQPPAI